MDTLTAKKETRKSGDVRKLVLKVGLLAVPALLVLLSYILGDPFKVVLRYDNYYEDYNRNFKGHYVELCRSYITVEHYLRTRTEGQYDSFIFGSSRSRAFLSPEWKLYLDPDAKPYHMDAYWESIFGIRGKVFLLDRLGDPIRNALVVLDAEVLNQTRDHWLHIFLQHPAVSHRSWLRFHLIHFRQYLTEFFWLKYWDFRLTGRYRPYMHDTFADLHADYDPKTNDLYPVSAEREMDADPDGYIRRHARDYRSRSFAKSLYEGDRIGQVQISMLNDIAAVFRRHGTRVKVVLSPNFNQVPVSRGDLAILRDVFGKENVYDYSGANAFTNDTHNFYDWSHFRLSVAREILRQVYGG